MKSLIQNSLKRLKIELANGADEAA